MVLNSPSQTGKGNRFAVDRVDYHAAKLRLYDFLCYPFLPAKP